MKTTNYIDQFLNRPVQERGLLYCFCCAVDPSIRRVSSFKQQINKSIYSLGQALQRKVTLLIKKQKEKLLFQIASMDPRFELGIIPSICLFLPAEFDFACIEHTSLKRWDVLQVMKIINP